MTVKTVLWQPKVPAAKVWLTFGFSKGMPPGVTIQSVSMSVQLKQGVDASPSAVLDGAPQILAGGRVMQRVQGGVIGASYRIRCAATLSNGAVIILAGVVPVVDEQ